MANFEFKISGLDELQSKLNRLPVEYSKKVLRNALRPAAEVFQKEIQLLAAKDTGWLSENVTVRVTTNDLDQGSAHVSFSKKPNPKSHALAIYEALWKEFGFVHRGGKHIPAQPFIRPAFESKKQEVVDTFVQRAKDALDTFR